MKKSVRCVYKLHNPKRQKVFKGQAKLICDLSSFTGMKGNPTFCGASTKRWILQ